MISKMKNFDTGISNNLGGDSYEIEADAEFFNHLSKRIYTDSMLAMVRELTANAWDSHIESGNTDKPVTIQSPTTLSPVFRVTDLGMGMDIDTLNDVYRKYGKSTKRSDITQTGGLGVGSKTPFAYTDSFTVYSVRHGLKHTMINYKENGIPKIKEIVTAPTDEPNGVTVEVPIKVEDFNNIKQRVLAVANIFNGNLIVKGIVDYDFDVSNIYRNPSLRTNKELAEFEWDTDTHFNIPTRIGSSFTSGDHLVIMGNIPYQLDLNKLELESHIVDFIGDLTSISKTLCIVAAVGAIDFSMSREHLEYSPRTIKYLTNYFTGLHEDVTEHLKDQVDQASCPIAEYQAQCALRDAMPSIFKSQDIPYEPKQHVITLRKNKRGIRTVKIKHIVPNFVNYTVDETKFTYPKNGVITYHLFHYTKNTRLRMKLRAVADSERMKFSGQSRSIVMACDSEKINRIRDIMVRNIGSNIEFVNITIHNLDDVKLDKTSVEQSQKILCRKLNENYTNITYGSFERDVDNNPDLVFPWIKSHGQHISYTPRFTAHACTQLYTLMSEHGVYPTYVGVSNEKFAIKSPYFIPLADFVDGNVDMILDALTTKIQEHKETDILLGLLKHNMSSEQYKSLTGLTGLCFSSSGYGFERAQNSAIECIVAISQILGYSNPSQLPMIAIEYRRIMVRFNRMSRLRVPSQRTSLRELANHCNNQIVIYDDFIEKRESKLHHIRKQRSIHRKLLNVINTKD